MFEKLNNSLPILVGVVLTMQLAGCIYVASDHRYHPWWHHEHDSGIDVHVHG